MTKAGGIGNKLIGTWINDTDSTLSVTFSNYNTLWENIEYHFTKTGANSFSSFGGVKIEGDLLKDTLNSSDTFKVAFEGGKAKD